MKAQCCFCHSVTVLLCCHCHAQCCSYCQDDAGVCPRCQGGSYRNGLIEQYLYVVDQVVAKYGASHLPYEREELKSIALEALVIGVDCALSPKYAGRVTTMAGFLYTVMRNRIVDHFTALEKGLQADSLDQPYPEGDTLGDHLADRDVVCASERDYPALYEAFEELPETQRDTLGMLYGLPGYGHYSRAEAAREAGIRPISLDYRREKGLAQLRRRLEVVR
jgi:DNA-directed RNA polymerase specialized sigma24 family protein